HGVLGEDDRDVVGEGDGARARGDRGGGDLVGSGPVGEPVLLARLRDVPVLAEPAAEVAAGGAKREHAGPGVEVVERLLLDGIEAEAGGAAVARQHHLAAAVLAHEAEAALPRRERAVAWAQVALDAPARNVVPPPALHRSRAFHEEDRTIEGVWRL